MRLTQLTESSCDVATKDDIEHMSGPEYDKYAKWKADCEDELRRTPLSGKRFTDNEKDFRKTMKEGKYRGYEVEVRFIKDAHSFVVPMLKITGPDLDNIKHQIDQWLGDSDDIPTGELGRYHFRKDFTDDMSDVEESKETIEEVEINEELKSGTKVKVMHPEKGKGMVVGKVVRYEKGDKYTAKGYVVSLPGLAKSEFVPYHKIHNSLDSVTGEEESYDDYHGDMSKEEYDKTVKDSEMEYTVWVGGTEVNDNWLTYDEALTLYDKYKAQGYDDIELDARIKQDIPQDIPMGIRPIPKEVTEKAKPDFLDLDKDGDKKEPMKKAGKERSQAIQQMVDTQAEWEELVKAREKELGRKMNEADLEVFCEGLPALIGAAGAAVAGTSYSLENPDWPNDVGNWLKSKWAKLKTPHASKKKIGNYDDHIQRIARKGKPQNEAELNETFAELNEAFPWLLAGLTAVAALASGEALSKDKNKNKNYDDRIQRLARKGNPQEATKITSENEFSKKVKEAADADVDAIKDRDDFIKMMSAKPKSSNKAIDTIKQIVADKQNMQVKFDDGKMKVDLYTASAVSQVYDALKPETQEKVDNMLRTKEGMLKMSNFAFKKFNEAIHEGRLDEWAFVPAVAGAIGRAVVGGAAKVAGSGAAKVAGNGAAR